MSADVSAVVLAAGLGRRMGSKNKALIPLAGGPALQLCMRAFTQSPSIGQRVLVMNDLDVEALGQKWGLTPSDLGADVVVPGGAERWLSSHAGCMACTLPWVLVHDAARALIQPETIEAVADAARQNGSALAAHPLADTLKREGKGGKVSATINRNHLWSAQTPQGFSRELLMEAFRNWENQHDNLPTDEAMLVEALGRSPMLVPSPASNFKITTPSDLELAEALLANR